MEEGYLKYYYTNESLKAITVGLNLDKGDNVLSICGSGCQPLAMAEIVNYVRAVDSSRHQVEYAHGRIDALKGMNYETFFPGINDDDWFKNRRDSIQYFCEEDESFRDFCPENSRLGRIRKNLSNIEVFEGNFFDQSDFSKFNKFYLSNALIWGENNRLLNSKDLAPKIVSKTQNLIDSIPVGALVYVADPESARYFGGFSDERQLTLIARMFENKWEPTVFRKVA